jgi:pSer/pThr/pTyr-binding forkhead associated (FHA) protein
VITLTLLHPGKSVPVQHWTFETASTIRIGRSIDNDVVLYSAVVSRHHLEIKYEADNWQVVNLGTNGTYIEGQLVDQTVAEDGMIIRLASSGPQIQIHLKTENSSVQQQLDNISEPLSSVFSVQQDSLSKKTVTNEANGR